VRFDYSVGRREPKARAGLRHPNSTRTVPIPVPPARACVD
jgi:hypothetical protein